MNREKNEKTGETEDQENELAAGQPEKSSNPDDVSDSDNPMNGKADVTDQDQLILDQQEKIAELENRIEELSESNLRKTAELDNARKRMQRERIQLFETSKASAIEHFLPVYDDLQRTLDALDEGEDIQSQAIEDGVKLVAEKFSQALGRYNVERIDQTGVPFDVDLHDALMRKKPEDGNFGSDIVLQVLENGYRMGDRTIRHAKVIVSE